MTHKLFAEQGGKGVSLSRFRSFLKRLQDGMLKLEFAHYDMAGATAHRHTTDVTKATCTAGGSVSTGIMDWASKRRTA